MSDIQVVCNTSPIIGLMMIKRLPLLWQVFDRIILPEAVYRELCADSAHHQAEIQEIQDAMEKGKFQRYQVKNSELVKQLYGKLHFGELEVIIAAKELNLSIAVIDERAARKMAADFLVQTIGIMGIFVLAKKKHLIQHIKPEIDALRANGYRISERLYKQILIQNGEMEL